MKGKKTGGRIKGQSFNLNLRSARNRMRRTFLRALPQLQRWLASDETWKSDGAAAARIVAQLGEWSAPRFRPTDATAEAAQATAAPAEQLQLPPVTADSILAAFKAHKARPQPPAALPEPTRPAELTPTLPAREAGSMRHAGIPQSDGSRVIPAAKRETREHHADPPAPRAPIDAEPPIATDAEPFDAEAYRRPAGSLTSVEAACRYVDQHEADLTRASASAGELPSSLQAPRRGR